MESQIKQIVWHPKSRKISQIPHEGLEYAWVSGRYHQVHQLVWCKDFMQDAIYGHINNDRVQVYGFVYDPCISPPLYMRKTRMMVTNWKDKNFGPKLKENCMDLLHQVERRLKMPLTVIDSCAGVPPIYKKAGVWILNSSRRWMVAPPMISFYTLLIRLGMVHIAGDNFETTFRRVRNKNIAGYYDSEDDDQLSQARKAIDWILAHGDTKLFSSNIKLNYASRVPAGQIHERCGLGAYASGYAKQYFPSWYKLVKD